MQWFQLFLWGALTVWASRDVKRAKIWALVLSVGLFVSMATQLWLLHEVGKLTVNTAVPLHLCSMMAVISIPMLLLGSQRLYAFSLLLGAPCALLALLFPAIADCARPQVMAAAFFRLHVLILCAPLSLYLRGFPLSLNPRPILLYATAYMALVSLFNALFNTNYLFLRLAPAGTPLEWLARQGKAGYVLSLEMIALLTLSTLSWLYAKIPLNLSLASSPLRRTPPSA